MTNILTLCGHTHIYAKYFPNQVASTRMSIEKAWAPPLNPCNISTALASIHLII